MRKYQIAIKQPYFMPYIGFWQEVNLVDTYVFFDDVNYINRGWINRNNILVGGQKYMFTISLCKSSQNLLINEISIADDFEKLKKTISMAYKKAPYYEETMCLLDRIFVYPNKNLARFVGNSIMEVANYLDCNTKFLYSSEIEKDETLKRQDKIIDLCKRLDATHYYDSTGAVELYDKHTFADNGLELNFIKSEITPYSQFKNEFIGGLSIIDVLMFNGKEKTKAMLDKYTLI